SHERGFLRDESYATGSNVVQITPKGWSYLEGAGATSESDTAFVAMSFDPSLALVYRAAIHRGIEDAGYLPIRADDHRHENLIDAEIHALIRRSRFVVADFTLQSNGVYYEAGFARGLGLRVFRLCRKADAKKVHFDQNHYHVLRWQPKYLAVLRRELQLRIEAEIGRGPRPIPRANGAHSG
ncbi:MAG: hypothetical protein ABIU54_06250, partial [Candidatus Eisenbacteria bacterium]